MIIILKAYYDQSGVVCDNLRYLELYVNFILIIMSMCSSPLKCSPEAWHEAGNFYNRGMRG